MLYRKGLLGMKNTNIRREKQMLNYQRINTKQCLFILGFHHPVKLIELTPLGHMIA